MSRVEFSKCKKCNKIKNVSDLKPNPKGAGMICADKESCKKEQLNIENEGQ